MIYTNKDELGQAYTEAEKEARIYFQPFDEYERLAANEVRNDLGRNMPRVNDGSLSGLLTETPMRVLAQMMTGLVTARDRDEPWITELANIEWANTIVPNANTQAPFFFKWQIGLEKALTYGGQPFYSFFTMNGERKGADFTLPYIRDVYLEPGKMSDLDSDRIFMNTWWTKLQLKNIIAACEEEQKKAKEQGRKPYITWNVADLREILEAGPQGKDALSINSIDKNKNTGGFYKLVSVFHRGEGAPFYTFAPKHDNKIVRTLYNTDPTGNMPITYLYAGQDFANPYGKGQVKTSGPTQNVLDYLTQADVLSTQIGLQPPIAIRGNTGNTRMNSLIWAPNAFWFVGDAQIDVQNNSTSVYTQFPNRYGLYKTQLMNLQGTSDASVSGESGNPQYSKTPQGVDLQRERTNAHDNYLRQRIAETFSRVAGSMINIHFANMQGSDTRKLVDEQGEKLMKAGLIDEDPMTKKPSAQEIEIIWENVRGKFAFDVDSESSIVKDNQAQLTQILESVKLFTDNPEMMAMLQQSGYQLKIGDLLKQAYIKMGINDWEKILVPMEEQPMMPGMPGQPQMLPGGQQMPMQQAMPAEEPIEEYPVQLPPQQGEEQLEQVQEAQGPQVDQDGVDELMERYNIDEELATRIQLARESGIDDETIAGYLEKEGIA
jgi:hypothetical protein